MKKKLTLSLIIVLFFIIAGMIFYLNGINRRSVKEDFKELTIAEGVTIKELLSVTGFHLTEHGESSMIQFLNTIFSNERIIYIGFKKENDLIFLRSRYEGFFPFTPSDKEYVFLDSPVGRIFEIRSEFSGIGKENFMIIIGFDYRFLDTFEKKSQQSFLMIFIIIIILMSLLIISLYFYNRQIYKKNIELIKVEEEKERYKDLNLITSEIAHEIKNPLNSIYLSFNALEKYLNIDKDSRFYKNAIRDEIKRITGIINSYSTVSKPPDVRMENFPISELFNQIEVLRREEFKKKGIEFSFIYKDFNISSDRNLLKQIFANLINNAVEAEATLIEIKALRKRGKTDIYISDDGKPFDPEIRKNIFKPLNSSKKDNMGLGLNITYKMVKSLNGEITLLPSGNGIKTFVITFEG